MPAHVDLVISSQSLGVHEPQLAVPLAAHGGASPSHPLASPQDAPPVASYRSTSAARLDMVHERNCSTRERGCGILTVTKDE